MSRWPKIIIRTLDYQLTGFGLNLTHPKILREISPFRAQNYKHITNQSNGSRLTKCHFADFSALPLELTYAGIMANQLTVVTVADYPHMFI